MAKEPSKLCGGPCWICLLLDHVGRLDSLHDVGGIRWSPCRRAWGVKFSSAIRAADLFAAPDLASLAKVASNKRQKRRERAESQDYSDVDEDDPPLFEWTCQDISVGDLRCRLWRPDSAGKFPVVVCFEPTAFRMRPPNKMPPPGVPGSSRKLWQGQIRRHRRFAWSCAGQRVRRRPSERCGLCRAEQLPEVVLGRRGPSRGLVGRVRRAASGRIR